MNRQVATVITWLLAIGLAIVFAAAAIPKIGNPDAFSLAIYRYQILPGALINVTAVYLPWLELCCAGFLLWPRYRDAAAALVLAMLLVFTVAIVASIARSIDLACGCFTVDADAHKVGWMNVGRNVLLLAAAVWVSVGSRCRQPKAVAGTEA